MTATPCTHWIPSNKANPCPVCGRTKDADCRTSEEGDRVICHHPRTLQPGELENGWAFTGNTSDDRAAHFVLDKPMDASRRTPTRVVPMRTAGLQPAPPAAIPAVPLERIQLLRIQNAADVVRLDQPGQIVQIRVGEDLIDYYREASYRYGPTQEVWRLKQVASGKKRFQARFATDGRWLPGQGPEPWQLWRGKEAIAAARANPGHWLLETEGEKAAEIAREGGLAAITQPGHAHKVEQIRARYAALVAAGVRGVVYLADQDITGLNRAQNALDAAALEGLPLVVMPASNVWPNLPEGGSIDDALDTPAERVASLLNVIGVANGGEWGQVWAEWRQAMEPSAPVPEVVSAANGTAVAEPLETPVATKAAAAEDSSDPRDKLALLRHEAAELLANRAPYAERLPILRAAAEELDLTLRDQELQAILTAARRSTTGSDQPVTPGQWLDMTPTPWIWEGLVMRGRLNLLIALPKQGKTSLLLAWIAAHHRHDPSFLDRTLHGPCPPVLIVGTDQGGNDWGQMLVQAGLAENHGNRVPIAAPLVALHHAGAPLHLDPEGIDRIASYAQQQPGLLVVIDSLSACVAPLGLKEESPQIAEPIHDLMQQLEPHGATVVLIHHAGKGRAGDGASLASRGSTALPAVASQTIKLGPASSNPNDPRKLLTTEGRGGSPQALVIQRNDGTWNYHGTAELLEQEQTEADGRKGLNDRQEDVLSLVRERWDEQMARTTAANVVEGLAFTGKDPAILALRTLQQLERKNFLSSIQTKGGERTRGRPAYEFWPVSDASRYPRKPPSETSETSETSLAPEDPER